MDGWTSILTWKTKFFLEFISEKCFVFSVYFCTFHLAEEFGNFAASESGAVLASRPRSITYLFEHQKTLWKAPFGLPLEKLTRCKKVD